MWMTQLRSHAGTVTPQASTATLYLSMVVVDILFFRVNYLFRENHHVSLCVRV